MEKQTSRRECAPAVNVVKAKGKQKGKREEDQRNAVCPDDVLETGGGEALAARTKADARLPGRRT